MSFVSRFFVRFSYFVFKILESEFSPTGLKRGLRLNSITHNCNLRSNTKKVEMFEKNRTQTRSGDKEFSSMVPHFLNMIFPHILDYNFKQLQSFIHIGFNEIVNKFLVEFSNFNVNYDFNFCF
jgi:hypothetical protein